MARLLNCEKLDHVEIQCKRRRQEDGVTASENLSERIKTEYDAKYHGDLKITYSWF